MATAHRDGLELHYTVDGEGSPPIVLGHSFLCTGAMWEPQVPRLAESYRVVNVDARGHGESGAIETDFTLYDMVDDVVAVLDDLGLERAVWAGLSVGGMVALRAALTVPDRVEAIVVMDSDARIDTAWNRLKYAAMGAVARTAGVRPLLPPISRLMFGATTHRERPELVEEWTERFAGVHVPSILRMLKAIQRRDELTGRLHEITVPTLVLVGAEDRTLPLSRSRTIARGIPGAELVEIAGAGHLATLDQPEAVTEAMLEFLDGL